MQNLCSCIRTNEPSRYDIYPHLVPLEKILYNISKTIHKTNHCHIITCNIFQLTCLFFTIIHDESHLFDFLI
jgi:hypothetical protein